MSKNIEHKIIIPEEYAGLRLDQALAKLFPQYSRSRLKQWLENEKIFVNQEVNRRPRDKVQGGEVIEIHAELEDVIAHQAEAIALDIIYEDEAIIVLNKSAGMVVHPAAGQHNSTLLNALLYHAPKLAKLPRAGIVHRLDKDTSGLLVIAKTLEAHTSLVQQLQKRKISREYCAIVLGLLISGGTVDAPIGRHPRQRIKMAVVESGKPAVTHYRILEKFQDHTYLSVKLETGRTHQIRVHMAHIHHPIVGDQTYAGRMRLPKGASDRLIDELRNFKRQALHASQLGLHHPISGEWMTWQAELPEDMQELLEALRNG